MASDILINPSVLKKCIGGSEQTFIEAIENAANVNTRLCIERKMRLPFLDSQTGVAQNHTALWHPYKDRQQGQCKGQLYSYPVKRWKKKKRLAFMNAECKKTSDIETGEADNIIHTCIGAT
ncbi:zinc finger protein ubi-d4 [Mytilus galloprovincialis]|uniref:Zinc finger protein ubi-d4 n=1 Tax=Mytilus galloprovincialis TaxID=29158 RepID=A0A8B6FDY7_MYTGA|nr:zinc finger protein ubi-d4 [Mytilus galloprovincialis]